MESPENTNPRPSRPAPPPVPAATTLGEDDLAFVSELRDAGLVLDLVGPELARIARTIDPAPAITDSIEGLAHRIDLLEAYYAANGEAAIAKARRLGDRFFCQREGDPITTTTLLASLAELAPELGEIALERIGGGAEGPLVLRAGEHFAALLDDYEEHLDTGEVDLREVDAAEREGLAGTMMVTVRGLVRAVNVLLDRNGVRERLVPLRSDPPREVYVAVPLTEAIELARLGHLEEDSPEEVMELCSW
jgi:hypothetical protein